MKKIVLITIFYVITIILYYFAINYYINKKDDNLCTKAYSNFYKYFRSQRKYIDTYYNNKEVVFSKCNLPNSFKKLEKGLELMIYNPDEWKKKFSDIVSFYKIDDYYDGWQLFAFEELYSGVMYQYYIYPSYIGLKYNTDDPKTLIERSLNDAYEFYTTNSKSNYYEFYKKGNKDIFYDIINEVRNEYYYLEENNSVSQSIDSNVIGKDGAMYNDFQKTFVERTKYKTYEIKRLNEEIASEKKNKLLIGLIIITLIFTSLISYFIFVYRKNKKLSNETLYDQLKRLCNPINFMKPYDEKKGLT